MDIKQAIDTVNQKFHYQSDPRSFFTDYWFVMQEKDGQLRGDCDDYSVTVLWYLCNENFWTFIWNVLVLHRYRLHRVETATGEYHVIGEADGWWFDNWTCRACSRDELFAATKHKYLMLYLSPIIAWFLVWGYFRR
jgi:hypothetical protein